MFDPGDLRLQPRNDADWGSERGLFREGVHGDRSEEQWDGRWRKNADELRMKDAALLALDPVPGMRVLDLGSADGAQMVYCTLMGAETWGQDLSEASVAVANAKLERLGVEGRAAVGDATQLRFDADHFDAIISSDFHEHLTVEQQHAVLRETWRVLRPGGRLVIKTPNLAYLRLSLAFKRMRELLRGGDPRRVLIPHTPGTSDPQHIGLVDRNTIERQLQACGYPHTRFFYTPPRVASGSYLGGVLSCEMPVLRDWLGEAVLCIARKPIASSFFPT